MKTALYSFLSLDSAYSPASTNGYYSALPRFCPLLIQSNIYCRSVRLPLQEFNLAWNLLVELRKEVTELQRIHAFVEAPVRARSPQQGTRSEVEGVRGLGVIIAVLAKN